MDILGFLKSIFKNCDAGYLTIWTLPDKRTAWFSSSEIENAAAYAIEQSDTKNVYFGLGLRKDILGEFQRGNSGDISVLTAFWIDIDIIGEGHKQTELPLDVKDVMAFLDEIPQRPSIVVHSGGGIHAYWLFDEPIRIATPTHRQNVADTLSGFQNFIIKAGLRHGWKLDNTSDLARVLRLPDTLNHKIEDAKVYARVLSYTDVRYTTGDFRIYKNAAHLENTNSIMVANVSADRKDMKGIVTGSGERIFERCTFMQYCRDNAATLPEPYWHAMITNLALAKDGHELCHKASAPYERYSQSETNAKINRAVNEQKPHTCRYIKESLSFDGCGNCGVKAPISHTIVTKEEQVREILEQPITDYSAIFNDEYVEALTYAKGKMPADYAKFKNAIKGKANIRDIEACIKAKLQSKTAKAYDSEPLALEGIGTEGLTAPSCWDIGIECGVKKLVTAGNSVRVVVACPVPVIISKRLRNIDTKNEKLEISFYRDNRWHSFIGQRSEVFNRNALLSFGNTGLPVNTGTSPDLVEYLADFENANMNTIPCRKSISRVGWISDSEYYPFTQNEDIEFESDSTEAVVIYNALQQQGDFETWKNSVGFHRTNPTARFLLGASFASPLLEKVRNRVFFVHVWHDSRSGKTALLKAALSIWGDPLRLISSFNATQVGLERKAAALDSLPFAIDELQALNEKRVSASSIVYNIGSGFGKLRGAKAGGIETLSEWRTIVLTTGEQPITNDSSMDGVQSRVFELYAKMVEREEEGTKLHQTVERNFGHAGCLYLRYICNKIKSEKDCIERDYERIFRALEQRFPVSAHTLLAAVVCLGDYYASQAIWNEPEDEAFEKAVTMGVDALVNNKALLREEAIQRAWEFSCDWVVSNAARFNNDSIPQYGTYDDNGFWVIPQYLHKALEENGFNVTKSVQGFKERGLIPIFEDKKGRKQANKVVRMGANTVRAYRFELQYADGVARPLTGKKSDN